MTLRRLQSYADFFIRAAKRYFPWHERQYAAPSPQFVKIQCLLRNAVPDSTWVETGTYYGQTTEILARHSNMVYSIEPEPTLYSKAVTKFSNHDNVELINGTSEQVFPELLPKLAGNMNFWLDGHYSAGGTFEGQTDTPIRQELAAIETALPSLGQVAVLIDDIRCFDPTVEAFKDYPSLDYLVDWARKNKLRWHIEHDIFIACKLTD